MKEFSTGDIVLTSIAIGLILLWLFGIAFYLKKLINEYTLKDWGDKVNPYESETLGLPRGTLRAVLTLTLLVVVVILVCASMVITPLRGGFESLVDAFQVMLAFYFGSKIMHHITESDKKKSQSQSNAKVEIAKVEAQNVDNESGADEIEEFHDPNAVG